jgi:hypothetical protein
MTLDDALDSLVSSGPSRGDGWKAWRETRAAALTLLSSLHPAALAPRQQRLREICVTVKSDREALLAVAVPLLRLARSAEEVEALLHEVKWRAVLVEALGLVGQHDACWDVLVELAGTALRPSETSAALSKALRANPDVAAARLAGLAARSPELAAHVAVHLAVWDRVDLSAFGPTLVGLAQAGGKAREDALVALGFSSWRHRLGGPVSLLEGLLPTADEKEATTLARVIALEHLRGSSAGVEGLLRDPRVEVRLGAVEALAHLAATPECWSRLVRAGVDDSALVRDGVFGRARGLVIRQGLDAADARALAASLDSSAGPDAANFLAFVFLLTPDLVRHAVEGAPGCALTTRLRATLDAPGSRACARCGTLPRKARWDDRSAEPAALSTLEAVPGGAADEATLLRCPSCRAHFLCDSSSESDVNSRREAWWYHRLTLRELQLRYAARVDFEHPRLKRWDQDLRADLTHVDPAVGAEAAWELDATTATP